MKVQMVEMKNGIKEFNDFVKDKDVEKVEFKTIGENNNLYDCALVYWTETEK
jgi:hypothetical protein